MALKAMNLKMEDQEIREIREVAAVFNMTMTDVVREAVQEYVERMKQDPFYRLTCHVADASAEESAEILSEIGSLTDDDLRIAAAETIEV